MNTIFDQVGDCGLRIAKIGYLRYSLPQRYS